MQSPVDADETAQRRIRQSLKNVVVSFHTVYLTNGQYTRQKDKASTDAAGSSPGEFSEGEISGRASFRNRTFRNLALLPAQGICHRIWLEETTWRKIDSEMPR
jgi:hypothetical protein